MHFSKIIAAAFLAAPFVAGQSSDFPSGAAPTGTGEMGPRPTGDFEGHHSGSAHPSGGFAFPSGGPRGHFSRSARVEPTGVAHPSDGGEEGHAHGSGFGGAPMTGSFTAQPTGGLKPSGLQRRHKFRAAYASGGGMEEPTGYPTGFPSGFPSGFMPSGFRPSGFMPTGYRPSGAPPQASGGFGGHYGGHSEGGATPTGAKFRNFGRKPSEHSTEGGAAPTGGFGGHQGGVPSGIPSGAAPSGFPSGTPSSGFGGPAPTGSFGEHQGGFPSSFPSGAAPSGFSSGAMPSGFGGAAPTGFAPSGHESAAAPQPTS
ncbi:hypothetical protein NHQ30_002041 [Ciborinia camelliae]|nr:hypothetical protein NHQ30_002041 [Ciborinia camelliae]